MLQEDDYVAGNPQLNGSDSLIVISGCSGGGKSTLIRELANRGYDAQPEAGRQIVKEQMHIGGDAVPWTDRAKFTELCVSRSMYLYNNARPSGKPAVFDRSIIEFASGFAALGLAVPQSLAEAVKRYRYAKRVFFAPPWEALFVNDEERRHSFAAAQAEYESLIRGYQSYDYEIVVIPKTSVSERADFFEEQLESAN
ncbi:MAG: AAA family ATPase [Gammaproteobacteria bacterium]|nr:AAA family ATPase [Gammaproteobacteria bacterium]